MYLIDVGSMLGVKVKKNKKARGVMFVIIITFLIFGCMSIKTHKGYTVEKNHSRKTVDKKYLIGVDNFVYLIKKHTLQLDCEIIENDTLCTPMLASTASGFVFSSDNNTVFVLTAAHFCKKDMIPGVDEEIIGIAKDLERPLTVLTMDEAADICLLMGVKYEHESFHQIELSQKEPDLGSDVYTVAGPNGIGGPGFRPVFVGKFAGCDEKNCMTTLPATFGSSGAGIYTKDGKLITIVMAVTEGFENLVLSPSQKDIHKFIFTIDNMIDIYQY